MDAEESKCKCKCKKKYSRTKTKPKIHKNKSKCKLTGLTWDCLQTLWSIEKKGLFWTFGWCNVLRKVSAELEPLHLIAQSESCSFCGRRRKTGCPLTHSHKIREHACKHTGRQAFTPSRWEAERYEAVILSISNLLQTKFQNYEAKRIIYFALSLVSGDVD